MEQEVKDVVIDADSFLYALASPPSDAWKGSLKGKSIGDTSVSIKKLKKSFKAIVRDSTDIAGVESIANDYKIGETIVVISDPRNFRYDIYPEYKANRKGRDATEAFLKLRKWARKKYAPNQNVEADDVVAYHVRKGAIGFSIDKDLFAGVAGTWFNQHYKHREWVYTSKADAEKFNLIQTVMGDLTDNIRGIEGVGEKTAIKLLDNYGWNWKGVVSAYNKYGLTEKDALLTARLVSMKQWTPKKGVKLLKLKDMK